MMYLICVLLFLVVYHHLLYPVLLKVIARQLARRRPELWPDHDGTWPTVSVIVPCYNESDSIDQKLHNLGFVDYPEDRLEILLVDDGSGDDTVLKIQRFIAEHEDTGRRFRLIEQPENRGKVAAINRAMQLAEGEIAILSDTSALISIDALQRAVRAFQKPDIGAVCATYRFLNDSEAGESRYWQFQTEMKRMESQLGSTLGAHGALYAFRAEHFEPLPADTINDDFILPMQLLRRGLRCVYDADMIAVELERATQTQDFNRRKRIAAGNLQQALRLSDLLHPRYGWVAWNFASGKFLRAFMPFVLLLLWGATAWNPAQNSWVFWLFMAQTAGYALALLRHATPGLKWPSAVNVGYYLVQAYLAGLIGAIHQVLQPAHFSAWQRADAQTSELNYLSRRTLLAKRTFDIGVALFGLLVTLPLWPIIALIIRLESNGPVLFRQMRIGRALPDRTELFEMMKFRTMRTDAEVASGAVWASTDDPRITRVGRFLRKTRLDELPQLINVLRGDMSLVGPRPERPGIGRDLDRAIPFYAERTFFVPPGITGLAQVNQGYDTCLDDVKSKLLYDHAYALSLSGPWRWFCMDCRIAFKTLWVMVAGRGQ